MALASFSNIPLFGGGLVPLYSSYPFKPQLFSVPQARQICLQSLSSLPPHCSAQHRDGGSCYRVSCRCLCGPSNPCGGFVQSPLSCSSGGTALQTSIDLVCPWRGDLRVFLCHHFGPSFHALFSSTSAATPTALRMGRTNSFKCRTLTSPAWLPTQVPLLSLAPQPQSYLLYPQVLLTIILFSLQIAPGPSLPCEMPFLPSQPSEIPSIRHATCSPYLGSLVLGLTFL